MAVNGVPSVSADDTRWKKAVEAKLSELERRVVTLETNAKRRAASGSR